MADAVTCLFVDDDPGVRELVALNLRAEGIRVHLTNGGYGVERLIESTEPDIVLLDIMMPERDGYEVLRSLKRRDCTRDIPVVVLSARASDAEIWEGWQAGADYYLTKPFNVDELIGYIRMIVAERRTRSGAA